MVTTLVGIERFVSAQPEKELLPILVTEVGIYAIFNFLSPGMEKR